MPEVTVDLDDMDRLEKLLSEMPDKILDDLDGDTGAFIRQVMSETAKPLAPVNKRGGGGSLRQSIDSDGNGISERSSDGIRIGITAHSDYAIYVEWGTGYKGDPRVPHTPRKSWAYYDKADGQLRIGKPQEARHFMEPALMDNADAFCEIIAGNIKEVFEQ